LSQVVANGHLSAKAVAPIADGQLPVLKLDKIAAPETQVVALVGDGSFQFGVQALWTAVRYEVPVAIIVWNNGGYQANRRYLHDYGRRAAATGKYIGVSLESPTIDHVAICKAYGVEADLEWRPVQNLLLTAGASYLHSEIKDKRVYAQVCALNGVVVCTVENPTIKVGANTFAQIDGQPLPNAPKYNLNFTARYNVPVGEAGRLFAMTDWNVQGYTNFVLYKTKEFYAKGAFEGGLKLGYENLDKGYEIALFGRNITNEKNLKGVIENYMAAVYNEPRIVGVSFRTRF